MNRLRFSKFGQNKLVTVQKKFGTYSFQTAGIYLCEDICFVAADLSDSRAVDGFVVSPSCFHHQYTKEQTYGGALSDFLRDTAYSLRKSSKQPMLLAMSFPEYQSWRKGEEELLKLLDDTFRRDDLIIPILVYLSDLLVEQNDLLVQVDKSWTCFTQANANRRWQTAASFGTGSDYSSLRLNDYLHDSTATWQGASFSSWEKAMKHIYTDLIKNGWPHPEKIWIVSDDARYDDVKKAITSGKTVFHNVVHVSAPANILADYASKQLKAPNSTKTATGAASPDSSVKKASKVKPNDDPFDPWNI